MRKSQRLAGLCAPPVGLGGVFIAMATHRSWWSLTDNAISDLGRVGLPYNGVMNLSLIAAAILGIYYAIGLFSELGNTVEKVGVGIFILGLVFLALIGIFPEGTSPHYYVSWGFFVTGSVGLLITGLGFWLEGERDLGAFTAGIFVVGWILAVWAFRSFEGVAIAEFIGVFAIVIWHYAVLWAKFYRAEKRRKN